MSGLPTGWAFTTLGEVTELKGGLAKGKSRNQRESVRQVPYLRVANVQQGHLRLDEVLTIDATENEIATLRLENGDVLFNEGGDRDKLGRGWVWEGQVAECIHQNHVFRSRPLSPVIDSYFLSYWGNSQDARRYFLEEGKQTTNLASISISKLSSLPVPLPPLAEQRRIVAKIEVLMAHSHAARAALSGIPTLLDSYRRSVLSTAFKGRLTSDWREIHHARIEHSSVLLERIRKEHKASSKGRGKYHNYEPGNYKHDELPEGWVWAKWAEVGLSQNGRAFPSSEYCDNGIKLLRPGNMDVSGELIWTLSNSRSLPARWGNEFPEFIVGPNQLVMNLTAQSLKDEFLGRVCLTGPNDLCLLNQRLARLTPINILPKFCLWLFKSPYFREFVESLNTGSLIQHMFTSQLDNFVIPLPPLEEQEEIVSRIEALLAQMPYTQGQLETQVRNMRTLDQSVLAKAFRGELVPQDPADEPAESLLARMVAVREARGAPSRRRGSSSVKPMLG